MLISKEHLQEQRTLHAAPRGYGGGGYKWAAEVAALVRELGARSVLDYGCGQGTLARALPRLAIAEYDPAIVGKDHASPADLVVCTDVLEHVEPECIGAVIEHLRSLTQIACLVAIATRPSGKFLSDGRDAHVLIRSPGWWMGALTDRGFSVEQREARRSGEWTALLT